MADDLESRFWGDCSNTYGEETKQLLYLQLMGFQRVPTWRTQYAFDGEGKSYIDIGGGPCSVLLKFDNRSGMVVDPAQYPAWVSHRYWDAGLNFFRHRGEDFPMPVNVKYHTALIYNCLQHCDDPAKVIANARACANELVMFEWIDMPPHEGHPHMLTEALLNEWTGQKGRVFDLKGQSECYGRAWVLPRRS